MNKSSNSVFRDGAVYVQTAFENGKKGQKSEGGIAFDSKFDMKAYSFLTHSDVRTVAHP